MKTTTKNTALLLAALLFSVNIFANIFTFSNEGYINDIPANVEVVINQVTYERALAVEFSFEEEGYIDDIPVEINDQTSNNSYIDAISQDFNMEEEEYIDDIPASIMY